ncbi:hypothetical protein O181_110106 [Austropuccinia psidii MF-1]|uniref:Uncharacterized protein n=1 Tax=Austropuccinia psidii MF-1 TaxID=1389203 RepID=A0A9Q3JXY8_9BASI|nr:hypothetical protein [Austropuccinia psidii MF-1]
MPKGSMQAYFKYEKERWYKSHKPHDFKLGYLVLVSTLNFNEIKGPMNLKYYFTVPFMIKALHGSSAMKLELTGELMNKHPKFPENQIKPQSSNDKELFPLKNKTPIEIPPIEEGEEKKIVNVLRERNARRKK